MAEGKEQITLILTHTVFSYVRKGQVYGHKGASVRVISELAGIYIVESETGLKFAYRPNKEQIEEKPPPLIEKQRFKPTTKKKTIPNNKSLFD